MGKATVFDKASFNSDVRSAVVVLESKVEKYLSDLMQEEAKSKVDNSFKDTLAQFKKSVTVLPTTTFPEEVYKVLLARHTVKHKLEIKNIDGTLIKEMEAYIASILGTEDTVKTKDGKSYVVNTTLAAAGLATVTDNDTGRQYELTWRSDAAKNSLYDLLGGLKTWSQNFQTYLFNELKKDVRDALIGKWFNALLSGSGDIAKEVYGIVADYLEEGGDATDIPALAADNYSDWLSKLTNKFFPATNKKVNTLRSQCQTLDKLAADTKLLKDYKASDDLTADTIKSLTSYKKFITAYNKLQTAIGESTSNFDSLIPDYIGYKITSVGSDTFNEDNATIICATGNNQIEITGSKVSVNAGKGNDTITSGTYDAANSNVKITAGTGDDEIYNYSSNSTIDAGDGNDFIRSDSHGKGVSIVGGNGNDTVDSHGNYNRIEGGAGADSISNYGNDVTISGDDGADTILNYSDSVTIDGGAGDDDILVMGGYVDGGTGVDTIAIQGSNVTAYGGGSFDMLPTKDVFNIASGVSNVYINDFEFGDVLNLPAGTYTARIEFGSTAIRNSSGKLIVCLSGFTEQFENHKQATDGDGNGNNYIYNTGSHVIITAGAGNDVIYDSGGSGMIQKLNTTSPLNFKLLQRR